VYRWSGRWQGERGAARSAPPLSSGGGGGRAPTRARARGTCGCAPARVDTRGGAAGSTGQVPPRWVHPNGAGSTPCATWHSAQAARTAQHVARRPGARPTSAAHVPDAGERGARGGAAAAAAPPDRGSARPWMHTRGSHGHRAADAAVVPVRPVPVRAGRPFRGKQRVHSDALGQGGGSSGQSRHYKVHPDSPVLCTYHAPTHTGNELRVGDSAGRPPVRRAFAAGMW